FLSRKKRIELIHAADKLAQFEFHARHGVEFVTAAPEEGDHLSRTPAALFEVAVGAGIALDHVFATAKKLQGHAGRASAEMPLEFFDGHIFADQFAFIFTDDVLGQDWQPVEIVPVANVLSANTQVAKEIPVVGNELFGMREKAAKVAKLFLADLFGRTERSGLNLLERTEDIGAAQAAGQCEE